MSDLYHKIQSVYKRDPSTDFKAFLKGQFSLPEFEYLASNIWEWTEKFNGECLNINYNHAFGGSFSLCGKTVDAQIHPEIVKKFGIQFLDERGYMLEFFRNIWGTSSVDLFLEGIGPGIHGGGKYGKEFDYVLFDVLIDGWWLRRKDVFDVGKKLGIKVAPVVGYGTLYELCEFVKRSFLSSWGDFQAEGVVARPQTELKTRGGARIITKLKHTDFRG